MLRELSEEDLDTGKLIDLDEFIGMYIEGEVEDSDGYGLLVYEGEVDPKKEVSPSDFHNFPEDATDILWFTI